MYKLSINERYSIEAERTVAAGLLINGVKSEADIKQLRPGIYHVIESNRSYNVEIVNFNGDEKNAEIKVNNHIYHITAKDQFDILLDKLGFSDLNSARISEIKAPMPGLVLKVFVNKGDIVKKGDNLFVLEAMKMENIIKSPADVVVEKILIKSGDKVEKGQILMSF
ncbi:biotin/lipoyl-containing protein [Mucilaginibacter gossypii]|uniref:biotin/lipoyl-containing protein n=1 Tax=Mucilaginibacter gossypii TaxID=551996 RepID=UPI000DCE32F9|nr:MULTISPECIES: acetyl-CoA carboxylase biotin carboxyl carrier protein subunit [Mucilaginibacter]QTE37001.1 biotin/lipoyl-containing protein [Mucilaginibacter gossypii]RAV49902.1 acetyl-CoA carboxylase biotin carboxyl carrier protein subunit [Mucilaginibacter rubeus]